MFNISYPSNWELGQASSAGVVFTAGLRDAAGNFVASASINISNPPETYTDAFQYAEEMTNVWEQLPDKFIVYAIEPTTIQGQEAATVEFEILNSGVSQSHVLQMMTLVNSQLWTIMYSSDSELFEEHKTDFEIIIGTLQMLGETPMEAVGIVPVPKAPTSVAISWSSKPQIPEKAPIVEVVITPQPSPVTPVPITHLQRLRHSVRMIET